MRGFLAVASREIARRRGVFVAAAATAVFPFLVPLISGRQAAVPDLRIVTVAVLALVFSAAFSLILGMSTLGQDLSEGRLGFYFSRPIAGPAIWAGKLAGALLVILLATAIVLLPASLFDLRFWLRETPYGFGPLSLLTSVVIAFLALGNAGSLAVRSRSAWVAADLAALALWTGLMGAIARPLLVAQEPSLLRNLGLVVAACCAGALLAAGGAQVSIGRLDSVRGNRARFATLWGLFFAIAAVAFGGLRWFLSPSPRDLDSLSIGSLAPSGTWIEIRGRARGRGGLRISMFYDLASGRFVRGKVGWQGAALVSRDGSTAVWTEPSSFWADGPQDVWTCRLTGGRERVRTPISGRIWNLEISPEGSRIAILEGSTAGVFELPSGRLLASVPLSSDERITRLAFLSSDRLRLYRIPSPGRAPSQEELASIEVLDFDISARKLGPRTTIPNIRRPFGLTFDGRERRLLVWERGSSLSLFDLDTGRLLSVLANVAWDDSSRAFLSDGRVAVAESTGGTARLHLYSLQGDPERVFELSPATIARIGAEPSPGSLVLGLSSGTPAWGPADSYLLDLGSGRMRLLGRHLDSVASRMRWRLPQPEPGSVASQLFSRGDGALLRLDPATGKLMPILGR
jgi:hypothetical protein